MALVEVDSAEFTVGSSIGDVPPPGKAILSVDTTPVKGRVYIDGSFVATAPWADVLDPGTYVVSFGEMEGYITPEPVEVTLDEGDIVDVTGEYKTEEGMGISWGWVAAIAGGLAAIVLSTRKEGK